MIARNDITRIPKRLRDQQRQMAAHNVQVLQDTLNATLWLTIKGNAHLAAERAGEEIDLAADVVMVLPRSALDDIPSNFGIRVEHDKEAETLSIIAMLVKPKSNIILPGGG